jgi:hypothetical protein
MNANKTYYHYDNTSNLNLLLRFSLEELLSIKGYSISIAIHAHDSASASAWW